MLDVIAHKREEALETVIDYDCLGYTMHTNSSGHWFTVWNEFGSHVGFVERPQKASHNWKWVATSKSGKVLSDNALGPKAALRAVVDYAEAFEGEF
jgi:hypothetical protein